MNKALLLGLLLWPLGVEAQFNFTTNNGTLTVAAYTGSDANVVIPDNVGGLPVTVIGASAFQGNGLSSVLIPATVTNIEDQAFRSCSSLSIVYFEGDAPTVGNLVFAGEGPTMYILSTANGWSSVFDGYTVKLQLTCTTNSGAVTITRYQGPAGVNFVIPSTIGGLPVTAIAANAFAAGVCPASLTIPGSVLSIGGTAFYNCTGLTNVTLGEGMAALGDNAFAFAGLRSVTIPSSVTTIGMEVFGGCTSLTAINVDPNNSTYSSVNGVLYDKSQTTLIQYPAGLASSVRIPGFVTHIGVEAFAFDSNLTGVVVPDSVTNIDTSAFIYCPNLVTVTIGRGVTSVGGGAFFDCPNLTGVYFTGNAPYFWSNVFTLDNKVVIYVLYPTQGWPASGQTYSYWGASAYGHVGVQNNQFGFDILGLTDPQMVVQACTNLQNPQWITLGTVPAYTGIAQHYLDPQWTNYPSRYYRIIVP